MRRNSCARKLRSYFDATSVSSSTAQKRNDPLAQVLWVTLVATVQVNSLCVTRAGARDHLQGQLPAASYIKDAVAVQQSTSFLLCIESRSSTSTTPSTCSSWCVVGRRRISLLLLLLLLLSTYCDTFLLFSPCQFVLLSLWAAFACAAPSLSGLPTILSSSSLSGGYHGWPAVQVVRPVWTSHRVVQQPIIHSGLGLRGHGVLGGGYGHGWL